MQEQQGMGRTTTFRSLAGEWEEEKTVGLYDAPGACRQRHTDRQREEKEKQRLLSNIGRELLLQIHTLIPAFFRHRPSEGREEDGEEEEGYDLLLLLLQQ